MMQTVTHPGPIRASRRDLVACQGERIEVTLAPGIPLEDAVAQALAPLNCDSAWLELKAAPVAPLHYVIPAKAKDAAHVAWYSDQMGFEAGQIDHLGMIVGRHGPESFLHGHGVWTPAGGAQAAGHILAPQTVLATPAVAKGIALRGATFNRRADLETNFDLFHVDQTRPNPGDFAALRLLPNQDLADGIDAACTQLGWPSAQVHGIGSINTAVFADGQHLNSLPTEFLIRDAVAHSTKPGPGPDIIIVGTNPADILTGRLSRGKNAVLVTAELVLSRIGTREPETTGRKL